MADVDVTCTHCGHGFRAPVQARHRVLCGDATQAGDVARVMAGERAAAAITDPPYSVGYGERSIGERGSSIAVYGSYYDPPVDDVLIFMSHLPADVLVMTYPIDRHFFALADALRAVQMELRKELVWIKDRFSFWPGAQYQQRHEPILVCARKGCAVNSDVPANVSTVFEISKPSHHDEHPTARPIELWSKLVEYHVPGGDIGYDPFLGSGTTLMAAEQLGRRCFGIDIEPRYVDVTVRRWQAYTGTQATLDGDGRTFDAIAAERLSLDNVEMEMGTLADEQGNVGAT